MKKTDFKHLLFETQSVWILSSLYLGLYFVRVIITQRFTLIFLLWNLFLAVLPIFFIAIARNLKDSKKSRILIYLNLFLWFIFFPNSSYLMTDIIHLHRPNFQNAPFWFDAIFYVNYVILGLITCFVSLKIAMQEFVSKKYQVQFVLITNFIACLGIYIGREWRFNSWDILILPASVGNQTIILTDLIPFITVWPICISVWFWLWFKHTTKHK